MIWNYIVLILCLPAFSSGNERTKKVLLISMDGFRWDYLDMVPDLPNIKKMADKGVKLQYVNNTFITTTFATHYSIATGLWEEHHGIVGNQMYDPVFKEKFSYGPNIEKWWNGGEPIWITATKQKLKTATYFWPGSEVELQGLRPTFWKPYNKSVPFQERLDTVVNWFQNENVDMATLYFYEPDSTGHSYGPYSEEVKDKVRYMDGVLGNLMSQLKEAGVLDTLNIILTSDHGMTAVNKTTRLIDISNYVNMSDIVRMPDKGAIMQIEPVAGREQAVYDGLKNAHPNMTVYLKNDIPEHFHFKNHRRIMPILAIASDGWLIDHGPLSWDPHGQHGYDNRLLDMRPIFLAQGPNFKKNMTAHSINSVDIYPMICELLDIKPAPHNGTLDIVSNLLNISVKDINGGNKRETTLITIVVMVVLSSACTF
ncbi:ectonucleotide pyrophosphatase/phosphodiesterase family member 5 isoform X2 [Patella vulgata]|nr:ectonucleotide pyrophosphatase/phosphodiesterase family member 5 isoform X2 [Patella vulgata]XP_055955789.1 ectonucleotide pyrophosphatase/phosphodiesterase family member 5 isoform X2 [Patella vulgata]